MSEVASGTADHDPQNESTAVPSLLDATPGVNPVVASALRHYAATKESLIALMKRHAKSLSHETWSDLNKNVSEIGDALTLVSLEVAHLQGRVDQLQEQQERRGPGVPATYASVLAGTGAFVGTCAPPPTGPAETHTPPEPSPEHRETLLVYGKADVKTWTALTTRFNPVDLNIQNVSVRNISANGVSVQASNREGLDRLKTAIERDETIKDLLTPKSLCSPRSSPREHMASHKWEAVNPRGCVVPPVKYHYFHRFFTYSVKRTMSVHASSTKCKALRWLARSVPRTVSGGEFDWDGTSVKW
ncbi:hypothetical protein HPB47_014962 [Ixodes persulcatus]|uniref:Uncharacterized protein n=1 Tax=Ixodes persulcatus TaxID=34615 RepID=A0AC60QVL6_IXOPE|nr:hypothetical protein HPB47_014962 [Ixodes persulcatus]